MAHHHGARVTAVASRDEHEVARALRVGHVSDSRDTDIAAQVMRRTDGAGVDLVLESVGGARRSRSSSHRWQTCIHAISKTSNSPTNGAAT
ncbi:MAG: zinc-binding dehydrogenase [Jatrophihabitans sp.]